MKHDPSSVVTRRHFLGYKPGCEGAPPPLHVVSACSQANWFPVPRALQGGHGIHPGPALVGGGSIGVPLGIDPTDPGTWGTRGYNHSSGMCARFNTITPGSPFGEGLAWAP